MNEERIEMPNISNLIPYSVQVDDCRLISDPLEPKICPLCRAEVRPFFINFNDKMLMCENTECDYPFGIEELKFYKENDNISVDTELESQSVRTQENTNCSIKSEVCSTRAKLSPVLYDESQQFEPRALDVSEYLSTVNLSKKPDIPPENEDKEKNINEIINNYKLKSKQTAGPSKLIIKNEKYVKNLMHLQKLCKPKTPLLNQTELELFSSSVKADTSQYKIDIQSGDSNEPTIKVNLN